MDDYSPELRGARDGGHITGNEPLISGIHSRIVVDRRAAYLTGSLSRFVARQLTPVQQAEFTLWSMQLAAARAQRNLPYFSNLVSREKTLLQGLELAQIWIEQRYTEFTIYHLQQMAVDLHDKLLRKRQVMRLRGIPALCTVDSVRRLVGAVAQVTPERNTEWRLAKVSLINSYAAYLMWRRLIKPRWIDDHPHWSGRDPIAEAVERNLKRAAFIISYRLEH